MMADQYIVSFKSGSSGRFIANLIWSLITDSKYEYILSDFNSTHNFSPYATSFDLSDVPPGDRLYSNPETYKYFNFTRNPGVITLHAYPDFQVIGERFPDAKIVIVSYSNADLPEITGNSLLKNGLENILRGGPSCNDSMFFSTVYEGAFNQPYTGQPIPVDKMAEIFNKYQHRVSREFYNSKFVNPEIPPDFTDKTLVINYSDLCRDQSGTVNKLCSFTRSTPKDSMVQLYDSYLQGRARLVGAYMPWLDK